MSFILDALKKAESERHRASGPVLVDVRIAPPRRRLPAWAWVIGAMLLANLGVLTWLMLRKPTPAVVAAGTTATAPGTTTTAPGTAPGAAAESAPVLQPLPDAPLDPLPDPQFEQPAQLQVQVQEPPRAPAPAAAPVNAAGLRTAQELKAAGISLPPLVLNLHAWGETPAERYVLLNGLRLMEGEFTPDGIKVEAITEEGVVLQARGQRFLLPRGG